MKLPHFKKKFIAGALAAGMVMGAGGIAAAYFSSTASTTQTATAGTYKWSITLTRETGPRYLYPTTRKTVLTPVSTADAWLYEWTIHNTGTRTQNTGTVTVTITTTNSGCSGTNFAYAWVNTTTGGTPSNTTVVTAEPILATLAVWLQTNGLTQNTCQGRHITVTLTVSGQTP